MIQASLRMVAPADKCQEVLQVLLCLRGPTEVLQGCVACRIFQDAGHPEVLTYLVQWETEQQLQAHLRSERFRRLLPYIEMSTEPPEIAFSTITAVRGVELLVATLENITLAPQAC